jgi:uncharacterized protein (UPF0276 family)
MTIFQTDENSTAIEADATASLPRLGIGVLYNPALPDFIRSHLDMIDFVSIIPDMFQMDCGSGNSPRYIELESWIEFLDWLVVRRPIIAHNIALSIGTAGLFDIEYVEQIAQWHQRYKFVWHSDHLSFVQVHSTNGHAHNAGLAIPVPYDNEVLEMIAERIMNVQRIVPIPFIIENNVYYIDIPDQDMTEPEFLNRLTKMTGCGLLLDVHNVYANARNHGFDPINFVDQIELSHVTEVHIAGGNELGGMYTDSHAGPCPEPVWDLLEYVVPRAPNLCAITFEFHESYYPLLKTEGICAQLARARKVWAKHH